MSYTYLQEQGGVSSVDFFSDIPLSALSKSSHIVERFFCKDKETESYPGSPSGMTCEPLTERNGEELQMLCVEDSRARISVQSTQKGKGCAEVNPDYGTKWSGSFAKYDQDSCSWKTHQYSLFGGLTEFSEAWPRWGIMLDGACWEVDTSTIQLRETEYGYWGSVTRSMASELERLTPRQTISKGLGRLRPENLLKSTFGAQNHNVTFQLLTHHGLFPTAMLCENLMGWPLKWTELQPLETDKFLQWRRLHGMSSALNIERLTND